MIQGIFFIVFGIYAFLIGTGKVQASKDPAKNEVWRAKWGKALTVCGPLVVLLGVFFLVSVLNR